LQLQLLLLLLLLLFELKSIDPCKLPLGEEGGEGIPDIV